MRFNYKAYDECFPREEEIKISKDELEDPEDKMTNEVVEDEEEKEIKTKKKVEESEDEPKEKEEESEDKDKED